MIDDVVDQVGGRFQAQLVENAAFVRADGLTAQAQFGRNLIGSLPCGKGQQDLVLAPREDFVPLRSGCGWIQRRGFIEMRFALQHLSESLHQIGPAGIPANETGGAHLPGCSA